MTDALTRADVLEAYHLFFGRPPESDSAIDLAIEGHTTVTHLWRTMLESDEFARLRSRGQYENRYLLDAIAETQAVDLSMVESVVTDDIMQKLLARTRAQWTALGANDPHWSVIAQEEYRGTELVPQTLERFYESGAADAGFLSTVERRSGRTIGSGVGLELGCGVGRVTAQLATRFSKVIGVDISPGILALCRQYLDQNAIDNVDLIQVAGIEAFDSLPQYDFLYSIIVLQHNPPPVQRRMLKILLSKIRPGGSALFQIVTDIAGYEFHPLEYLDSPIEDIEMHALPMSVVLSTIREAGMDLIDIMDDGYTGLLGSKTIYAGRP